MTTLFGHLFSAARETRFLMWSSLALAALLLTGFYVGSFWGGTGIAAAWLVVHPSFSVYAFTRVRRILDLGALDYLKALRLGLDGTAVMGLILVAFQHLVAPSWPSSLRLAASIGLGAGRYGVTTWLLHRTRLRQIVAWLKSTRRGEAVAG